MFGGGDSNATAFARIILIVLACLAAVPVRAGFFGGQQWTQVPLGNAVPFQLAVDKDGSIWFTDYVNHSIGHVRFDPTPQVQLIPIDLGLGVEVDFVDGIEVEDEAIYFTFTGKFLGDFFTALGRMTREGRFDFVVIDD